MKKNEHFKQKLVEIKHAFDEFLPGLTEDQWHTVIIKEENHWTVLDVVAHMVEAEANLNDRITRIRQGQEAVPPDFNIDTWNAGMKTRVGEITPQRALEWLEQTRTKTLALLADIKPNEWAMDSSHPVRGRVSIEQYYQIVAGHPKMHLKDIKIGLALP